MAIHCLFIKCPFCWEVWAFLLMLTIVHLLIAQFPVHSDPSFFFLEVLSTLQKIVLSQSTVMEGLFVSCSAVSTISTLLSVASLSNNFSSESVSLMQETVETPLLFVFVYRQIRLRVTALFFFLNLWSMTRAENRFDCGGRLNPVWY